LILGKVDIQLFLHPAGEEPGKKQKAELEPINFFEGKYICNESYIILDHLLIPLTF
jgi:hypothetical protein